MGNIWIWYFYYVEAQLWLIARQNFLTAYTEFRRKSENLAEFSLFLIANFSFKKSLFRRSINYESRRWRPKYKLKRIYYDKSEEKLPPSKYLLVHKPRRSKTPFNCLCCEMIFPFQTIDSLSKIPQLPPFFITL